MTITIDTREQTPWAFPVDIAEVVRGTVPQGDYAIQGDEDNFAIERKSLEDFLGTISSGWERFRRELNRMDNAGFRAKVIVVEGDFANCCWAEDGTPPKHNHPRLTPAFIVKRIAQLSYDYRCSVIFAGNPALAAGLAVQILRRRQKDIDNAD